MVKNRKKRGFKKVLSKCLDCGNRFDIEDKECDECGSKNIRLGGRFKVNKAKECLEKIEFDRKLDQMVEDSMVEENLRVEPDTSAILKTEYLTVEEMEKIYGIEDTDDNK